MSNNQKNNGEKLNVSNVEPFSKYKIIEMVVCLVAVAAGLVYLYAPDFIPMNILLPVFTVCLDTIVVLRFIGLKKSGTKKVTAFLVPALLAVLAVIVSAATVVYFTALSE